MSVLSGKRILVTRAPEQARQTEELLRKKGAEPILFPCLEVVFHPAEVRRGLGLLQGGVGEALFTSANGVAAAHQVLGGNFSRAFAQARVAVVGQKTAEALLGLGVKPAVVPKRYSQEGLLAAYEKVGLPQRMVFFRASEGRGLIIDVLRSKGVEVDLVKAYDTVCPQQDAVPVIAQLQRGSIDAVLLASGKTARHYVQRIGDSELASRPAIAVISPQVERTCTGLGLAVQAVAKKATLEAMLNALEQYFEQGEPSHVEI
jgi:uroporphyrinogen-III synthase